MRIPAAIERLSIGIRRSSFGFPGFLALSATVLATAGLACGQSVSDKRKPNVVVVFIDDLGWTDLGCYGSKFY
ncbi:MAG: hypothetical protein OSA98_23895 [Rubripirellula sp.]|nr:hypothetical protein [Rubripirellula sp.]